jgi:hypothetical protein
MKALYLKALELLEPITAIKYADLDKGQLDREDTRPALQFPCVLIRIEYTQTRDIVDKKQKVHARLGLRVAFNFAGDRTGSNAAESIRDESLEYFDTIEEIHQAFQAYFGNGFSRFSRLNLQEERRNDGLKVVSLPYATSFIDG